MRRERPPQKEDDLSLIKRSVIDNSQSLHANFTKIVKICIYLSFGLKVAFLTVAFPES
jgi:hypothetical protein